MSNNGIPEADLTAYALGELEGPDRARVEAHLAVDPAARREVEAIRATAGRLTDELAREPAESLLAVQRAAVERELAAPSPMRRPVVGEITGTRKRWLVLGMSVAASVVIVGATFMWLLPPLNRARELARVHPDNTQVDLHTDGQWDLRQSPFTGMVNRDGPGATSFHDHTVTAEGWSRQFEGEVGAVPNVGMSITGTASRTQPTFNTESYDRINDNAFLRVADNPLSTFSIDVDTASYSNVRRYLNQNTLPPKDAVRIEELVNYFPYSYAPPEAGDTAPFAASVEVAGCPWNGKHRLVRIGLKGKEIAADERPASNLVFLVDVSGSMEPENKLPLVKRGLQMLVERLTEKDRVAIVVYAGTSGLALPPTPGNEKGTLLGAIDALGAGGSTNGAGGIERAYDVAVQQFIPRGVNRVILCTDGDFNVGVTDQGALTRLIEDKAKTGVFLSVLGFGMGNLKDATMEKLADRGNGNYAYIDTPAEARKVLVEQMGGTLVTIAKDVKVQVEFNPAAAAAYRLIGYENRVLAKEDFNDDKKDAGEIGAGHTVTALYEVVPAGADAAAATTPKVDELKYQKPALQRVASGELLTLKLRYKDPDGDASKLLEFPVTDAGLAYAKATGDYKFAAAVAAFGMILRDSPHKGDATLAGVIELAQEGVGPDENGYRAEFVGLAHKARQIKEAQGRLDTAAPAPAAPLAPPPVPTPTAS